jgi:hypothetical protein
MGTSKGIRLGSTILLRSGPTILSPARFSASSAKSKENLLISNKGEPSHISPTYFHASLSSLSLSNSMPLQHYCHQRTASFLRVYPTFWCIANFSLVGPPPIMFGWTQNRRIVVVFRIKIVVMYSNVNLLF